MNKSKIFIFFIIVFLSAALFVFIWSSQKKADVPEISNQPAEEEKAPEPVLVSKEDYKNSVKDIMSFYWFSFENLDQQEKLKSVEGAREKILNLAVPAEFKDLHLSLAISLDLIRQGLKGDSAALERGESQLKNLAQKHDWLK